PPRSPGRCSRRARAAPGRATREEWARRRPATAPPARATAPPSAAPRPAPPSPCGTRRSRRDGSPLPRRAPRPARRKRGRGADPGIRRASCPPQSRVRNRLVRGGLFRNARRRERLATPRQHLAHAAFHGVLVRTDHHGYLPERPPRPT